jgi:hypothetical protein
MPVDALENDSGGGGSGGSMPLPFGLPNIELPPPPAPVEHAGTGAPRVRLCSTTILSVNHNNSTLGVDPAEQRRQDGVRQDRGIAKITPIAPDR